MSSLSTHMHPANISDHPVRARKIRYNRLAVLIVLIGLGLTIWRAWVSDDAYITFRIVRNMRLGDGPVFNAGERVQVFTHPLWFLLLLAGSFISSNLHGLSVVLGLISSVLCLVTLAWVLRPRQEGDGGSVAQSVPSLDKSSLLLLLSAILLLASPGFVEFQTSGLENSLTHLLLFLLYGYLLVRDRSAAAPSSSLVILLGGLVLLNRPDEVPLIGPIMGWAGFEALRKGWRTALKATLALAPLITWEIFATTYYGSPFPNTAYAKICDLGWRTGLLYVREYLWHEPASGLTVLIAGLVGPAWAAVRWRRAPHVAPQSWWVSAGIWLQTAYVIWVGGDFMRGRFWITCLISAVFVLLAILRDLLAERDYERQVQFLLLLLFPIAGVLRIIEYLPVGPMTGFVSILSQERKTREMFILVVVVYTTGTLAMTLALLRARATMRLAMAVFLLHGLFILAVAGYRDMDAAVGVACSILFIASLLLLWRHETGASGRILLIGLAALAVMLMPHLEFNAYTSLSIGNGIVHEYDFYRGAWYDARFHRPDRTVQPGVPRLFALGRAARTYSERFGPISLLYYNLGFCGWEAGQKVHLIDAYGLADAFVARSPYEPSWRAGHVWHTPPNEYLEAIGAVNVLPDWQGRLMKMDPTLREEALAIARRRRERGWRDPAEQSRFEMTQRVVSGPIFSRQRFAALPRFIWPRPRPPIHPLVTTSRPVSP